MEKITKPLNQRQIASLKQSYGRYLKVTVDIVKKVIVVGCQLHTDGAELLQQAGSKSENLWGGGVNWSNGQIDTSAVFNLRPKLGNNSMEILDPDIRQKFIDIVGEYLFPRKEE